MKRSMFPVCVYEVRHHTEKGECSFCRVSLGVGVNAMLATLPVTGERVFCSYAHVERALRMERAQPQTA